MGSMEEMLMRLGQLGLLKRRVFVGSNRKYCTRGGKEYGEYLESFLRQDFEVVSARVPVRKFAEILDELIELEGDTEGMQKALRAFEKYCEKWYGVFLVDLWLRAEVSPRGGQVLVGDGSYREIRSRFGLDRWRRTGNFVIKVGSGFSALREEELDRDFCDLTLVDNFVSYSFGWGGGFCHEDGLGITGVLTGKDAFARFFERLVKDVEFIEAEVGVPMVFVLANSGFRSGGFVPFLDSYRSYAFRVRGRVPEPLVVYTEKGVVKLVALKLKGGSFLVFLSSFEV